MTNSEHNKNLIISTQVVEAGVDIDMDIGFKDRSLIDSDEQLAGRVNRNAQKQDCKVYLFDLDKEFWIYKDDLRYLIANKKLSIEDYKTILDEKSFDKLYYKKVNDYLNSRNEDEHTKNLSTYKSHLRDYEFDKVSREFTIIDQANESVFVPLGIHQCCFNNEEMLFLSNFNVKPDSNGLIQGKEVFQVFNQVIKDDQIEFIDKKINLKKIYGIMSQFMFSIFSTQAKELEEYKDKELYDKYGIYYLSHWQKVYSYDGGINTEEIQKDIFL